MVNTAPIQVAQGVSRVGFLGYISYGFLTIFVVLLVLNTIYIALQEKSFTPVIKNLGETFLLSTQKISEISRQIIENGGAYQRTDDFWTGILNYIWLYASLFMYLYVIYGWLRLIFMMLCWGPIYTGEHKFSLILLTLGIFLGLQEIILLGNAGITKSIDCFSGCEKSVVYYISLPFLWIVDLIIATPLIIQPATHLSNKILGNNTIY